MPNNTQNAPASDTQNAFFKPRAHKLSAEDTRLAMTKMRKNSGLDQQQFAELVGVNVDSVAAWQAGTRRVPLPVYMLAAVLCKANGYLDILATSKAWR